MLSSVPAAPDTPAAPGPRPGGAAPVPRPGLRLLRTFTLTSLLAFAAVGAALFWLQRNEERVFEQAQQEQGALFASAQAELMRRHDAAARASLLDVHESAHVTLARAMGNLLWAGELAPYLEAAGRLPIGHCEALPPAAPGATGAAADAALQARRACFAAVGGQLRALPGYVDLDRTIYGAMRASTVFKVKVFDRRGLTVYSSESAQIGEYAAANDGWRRAAAGQPASELTHRDRFSAFERVVENRDLISSYVPLRRAAGDEVLGVFEIYSDVTPFLQQTRNASEAFAGIASANEERVEQAARDGRARIYSSSQRFLAAVGALLAGLYLATLALVRNGQHLIDRQWHEQQQAAQREQLWHREKMAALATMADNVAHEVGNPLAVIAGLAQELTDPREPQGETLARSARMILEQTTRVATMTRRIADFAQARSGTPECVDIAPMLVAVCDFMRFDRRLRGTPIEFRPGSGVPACVLVPDHLNEVMMSLLQGCSECGIGAPIVVRTLARGDEVVIRIGCPCRSPASLPVEEDPRLEAVGRRAAQMGARLAADAEAVEVVLPAAPG